MNKPIFNSFDTLPFIPYNIISHLAQDPNAENFWKLIYYNEYDCLSQPNLTLAQKVSLIWNGYDGKKQEDCNIFLTFQVEDMQTDARTFLKLYKVHSDPINRNVATLAYNFDIQFGGKIAIVQYEGIPCNRADLVEMEILKSLNGADVAGAGFLQYNDDLSNLCQSRFNLGNNTNYTGVCVVMAVQISSAVSNGC